MDPALAGIVERVKEIQGIQENPGRGIDVPDAGLILQGELVLKGLQEAFSDEDLRAALHSLGVRDPDEVEAWFEDLASQL